MVKHKGASTKQVGAYKPPKRGSNIINKVVKHKFKKLKFEDKPTKETIKFNKQLKSAAPTKNNKKISEKRIRSSKELQLDGFLEDTNSTGFVGDISEEDIDSDDDLSLNEEELPTPPDTTTTEDESEEEEVEENNEDVKSEDVEESSKVENIRTSNEDDIQRTVFVGNLPKSVKKIKLKKWFSTYGEVESVRLRCAPLADPSMSKKVAVIKKSFHKDRNSIHGFVRFTTIAEAHNALNANGLAFDNEHHVRVDLAVKVGEKKQFDDKKAIFVGNLPFNAEEDQLRDLFVDCGDIVAIRIIRDKRMAIGKGFAFINFAARHSVRLALLKSGIELNGRKLRVQKALYNQEVEMIPQNRNVSMTYKRKGNSEENVMKFKKKKKMKEEEEEFEFQGLRHDKQPKPKKLNMKKKKLKRKKEVLKKILNTSVGAPQ